jgi:hypothetical protein
MGYIDAEQVVRLAEPLKKNSYGRYLLEMIEDEGPRLNEPYFDVERRPRLRKGAAL